jgi:hypothetical protein
MTDNGPFYPLASGIPATDVPPAGYNVVALNVEYHTPGFAIEARKEDLVWADAQFHGFAACYVDGIDPYENLGPQVQLLWRNATAGAPSGRCAEVELKVLYV